MILSYPLNKHPMPFKWFQNNLLKSKADKCHLLVSTNDSVHVHVAMYKLYENDTEKLLVVKFDEKVAFHDHIYDICKKAGRKISAVARMHGNCEETHLINVSCCLV